MNFVEGTFQVVNGLSGMLRDVLIRLCHVMEKQNGVGLKEKDLKIRVIIGLCQEHAMWKTHHYFVNTRIQYVNPPAAFIPNPQGGCTLLHTRSGGQCTVDGAFDFRVVFLDKRIDEGIYKWTVQVRFSSEVSSSLGLVAAPPESLEEWNGLIDTITDVYSFIFNCYSAVFLLTTGSNDIDLPGVVVVDRAFVAIEFDIARHVLFYFVNGEKIPYAFANVNAPVHFGIFGNPGTSVTSMSLRRLPSVTPSTVVTEFFQREAEHLSLISRKVERKRKK